MNGFLLDTHLLLWAAADDARLSATARAILLDEGRDIYFSVASIWEVVIKTSRKAPDFQVDAQSLRRFAIGAGIAEIPVRGRHVIEVGRLPGLHADPFDRILLAQATSERLRLLTVDRQVLAYGEPAQPV